jgi:hypothetical protein
MESVTYEPTNFCVSLASPQLRRAADCASVNPHARAKPGENVADGGTDLGNTNAAVFGNFGR